MGSPASDPGPLAPEEERDGGPSSAPGPAPPSGLAAPGASGDAVTQPRGRGGGGEQTPPARDPGPAPARFVSSPRFREA